MGGDGRRPSPMSGDSRSGAPPRKRNRSKVMILLADIVLDPGVVVAWLAVGLIAGWLAGQVMRGTGFGLVGDIVVGLIGAFIGGFVFGQVRGDYFLWGSGFWGSVLVAFVGAVLLLAFLRF